MDFRLIKGHSQYIGQAGCVRIWGQRKRGKKGEQRGGLIWQKGWGQYHAGQTKGRGEMLSERDKERLEQEFRAKAESLFEAVLEEGIKKQLTLSQMEEVVGQLKFGLTSWLVERLIEVQAQQLAGPGPVCSGCGREMRDKGEKPRQLISSQGQLEFKRKYYYCETCRQGIFPPGSTIGGGAAELE